MRQVILFICGMLMVVSASGKRVSTSPIGTWGTDAVGLPCFNYVGSVPYKATLANSDSVRLDSDPWFVLGNYQLTVFAHVSGQYELLTGQRAWARMNQGNRPNTGMNDARIDVLSAAGNPIKTYPLVGLHSLSADSTKSHRTFGCGYAHYQYRADKLQVSRTMKVRPSLSIDGGASAFLLTVTIQNKSGKAQHLRYSESIRAQYETGMQQRVPEAQRRVKYPVTFEDGDHLIAARFKAETDDPMLFRSKDDISKWEGFPPVLFMKDLTGSGRAYADNQDMVVTYDLTLRPGETRQMDIIIGYSMERPYSNFGQITQELSTNQDFTSEWRSLLPDYADETDAELRRELTWHAYMLEAMATYSDYYHETKIPQGTIYDYDWGQHLSARDNFQHALATIYYHPELTRSIIRYMLQRTRENGEIMLAEYGNGFAEHTCYQTSDQQLWFFLLLSEYLRVTGDYGFLNDRVHCYPVKDMPAYTVGEFAERCFDFLRHQIGTGSRGLVRLLNSDWCDAVYYSVSAPYNSVQPQGESHMNTAMACTILDGLQAQLQAVNPLLSASIRQWRGQLYEAYIRDWGHRVFPRRMYFAGKAYGDSQMFLDHLGFTLQMKDLPTDRKQALYKEMQRRLYAGEKLGAREQEQPELTSDDIEPGSRENGGFWYSLNGPAILGVATFDKPEAMRLLKQMSLANHARQFPQYWSSYWSAADNIESSMMPSEGLPDQTAIYPDIAIACAHVHAWMLYCYNRLKE